MFRQASNMDKDDLETVAVVPHTDETPVAEVQHVSKTTSGPFEVQSDSGEKDNTLQSSEDDGGPNVPTSLPFSSKPLEEPPAPSRLSRHSEIPQETPSSATNELIEELKMQEGHRDQSGSLKSLTSSTPGIYNRFDSPLSSVSRRKFSKQPSVVCSISHHGSSMNLSLHKEDSLQSLHSEDSFHMPTHTVISPNSPMPPARPAAQTAQKTTGRFSVSPAQSISISNTIKKKAKGRAKSKSECSYESSGVGGRPSPEPEMQFEMSDMSLHEEEEDRNDLSDKEDHDQPLLNRTFERKDIEIESKTSEIIVNDVGIDFDAYMMEVDENQQTVMSRASINTQDSATFEHAPLQCGNIRFVKDTSDLMVEPKKHYMCVNYDTPLTQVTEFMSKYWGMRNPKIVLSVISATESFKPWKSQRQKDDFQKGITKAANTTEMWIITNGIDGGVSKYIGDAVSEFNIEQQNNQLLMNPVLSSEELRRKRLTVIGIVPKDIVPYGIYFDGTEGVQVKNVGQKVSGDIYELNPDHTHFIMVEDDSSEAAYGNLRCMIEKQFKYKTSRHSSKRVNRLMSLGSNSDNGVTTENKCNDPQNLVPVVGLLVQGSPKNIDQVLFYVQNKMPVVVMKGSGGLADMIGFVSDEFQEKGYGDPDYIENFLKPELIKMITRNYGSQFDDNNMGKFILRDKIIQSVKTAAEGDGDSSYITVFSIKGWGASMLDLDKYILRALFKAQKHEALGTREQIMNDLQLTVDWNRPDLAWEMFQQDFTRIRIDKKMFEQSLLKKDREEFTDLFLTQGVKVHKYLNHRKLKYLFDKAEDREFFVSICVEGVLGITLMPKTPLPDNFIGEGLNRLIYKLSWIRDFIQPYELSMSSTGHYIVNSTVAERKAINSLMIWAVLMNRHKLAKKLWNRCDEPIGVALICSRIYREMTKYTMEQYQRTEFEEHAKEFGQMALGALAICWRDSSIQAYSMLGRRLPDFNNKSVIEIAHDAGYIHFLAHPCCQKWLTKMFFGNLQVKELDWGLFRLPYWLKILISAFFIFPMYLWIKFIPPRKKKANNEDDDNQNIDDASSSEGDDDEEVPHYSKSAFDRVMKKKSPFGERIKGVLTARKKKKEVPFFKKIYLLWTAPITKFWTTQVFYFAFLGLFCLATLWPACGNQYLDLLLWAWTAVIEMELVCRVYMKYHKYKTLSLVGNCIDILLIMGFLILLLVMRVLHGWMNVTNYIHAKTFMCYGLIYFFYRLLGVYLPISPTLGPMLLRMNRMVKHDFVAFIRMFLIFMIVGGVTIHAIIYPNWPLGGKMIRQVLTRPMYSMFLTPVGDLDGDPKCTPLYENISGYCAMGQKHFEEVEGGGNDDSLASSLAYCPYSSFSGYVITLQYLFICKLVLVTLLFAMFSLTIAKVDKEASEIWKFQRYSLIADFIERFSLPPPFTVFSFIYLLLKYIWNKLLWCKRRLRLKNCCFKDKVRAKSKVHKNKPRGVDDTLFWKRVAREYEAVEEAKAEEQDITAKHGDILIALQDDLKAHRKSMRRLGDRVVELERMIQSSRLYLEDIAHKLEKTEVMGITNVKGRFIHVAARQSPYPSTSITRFPVFDKYVPWEMVYDVYDPKTFSRSLEHFPEAEVIYVDIDMIELYHKREERLGLPEDEVQRLSPIPLVKPKWNSVETFVDRGERREIDRRSWINFNDQPLRYDIDPTLGIPVNPLGRTGLRGKGLLWRWGPNHVIKAVCTRWRRKYGPDLNTMTDFLYVEGKRVLEFIAVQKDTFMDNSYGLPGGILHGLCNPYSILCQSFMSMVFDEQDPNQYAKFDQSEMVRFFAQFATAIVGGSGSRTSFVPEGISARSTYYTAPYISESRNNLRVDSDQQGFSADLLYKGYLDDPRNTDNAWVEAEVWNFHYDLGDTFDFRLSEESSIKWKEVSPYVKMFGNETVIVQEAARIHDAYH